MPTFANRPFSAKARDLTASEYSTGRRDAPVLSIGDLRRLAPRHSLWARFLFWLNRDVL